MREIVNLQTTEREELIDITAKIKDVLRKSRIKNGLISLYSQGAASAIMIQENWNYGIQMDVVELMQKLVPRGGWKHDAQDSNGDSLLKAGVIGPSETIPIIQGELGLTQTQSIFFCEFDGPRQNRKVVCSIIADQ